MKIKEFRQTIFVDYQNKNYVYFDVDGWDMCNPYLVSVFYDGEMVLDQQSVFFGRAELMLPAVSEETNCMIRIKPFEDHEIYYHYTMKPVREWTIDLIASSHEDLGYCAYVNKLEAECAGYLDEALNQIGKDQRFRYLVEHMWWLKAYETYRTPEQRERLKKAFNDHLIEQNAPHSSNHTHWQGYEQLIRALYFSCIGGKQEWGISPETALYADMSGISWAAVSAYAQAGLKYAVIFPNEGFRLSKDGAELPKLFYWYAPNGKDKLLCLYQPGYREVSLNKLFCDRNRQYENGTFFMDETKVQNATVAVDLIVRKMENVPYDILPIGFYDDREKPTDMILKICDSMQEKWMLPKFQMATPKESLQKLEERFSDAIPCLSGDLSEQWADFATIAPKWMKEKRTADRWFGVAEAIAACNAIEESTAYPQERLREAMWRMCEFDDHCWATSSKHPQTMHRFNLNLVKRESAKVALRNVKEILQENLGKTDEKTERCLWNFTPFERSTQIRLKEGSGIDGVECQKFMDGSILTDQMELPSFGNKTIIFNEKVSEIEILSEDILEFETAFYKVQLQEGTRKVKSIFDKALGEDIIDKTSEYSLGEYIYVTTEGKLSSELFYETPFVKNVTVEKGKLGTKITQSFYEEQSGANIETEILFYEKDRTIDLNVRFKNAAALMGDYYDRYKKNVFIAVPIRVNEHHFLTELAGAVVDERTDRIPYSPNDFVVAADWIAAENSNYGIGILSQDMPVFHLGNIHYNKLSSYNDYSKSSNVFIYAASNRCNQLNFVKPSDCCGEYSISILPYVGRCQDVLPRWSLEKNYPPVIGEKKSEDKSYLQIDAPNVRLLAYKKAELSDDLFVLRVMEVGGKEKTSLNVKVPGKVTYAEMANGIEEPLGIPVTFDNQCLSFDIEKNSYATILIRYEGVEGILVEPKNSQDVRNVFSFAVENEESVVAFEVGKDCHAEEFEIYGDRLLAVVKNNGLRVQFVQLPYPLQEHYKVEVKCACRE